LNKKPIITILCFTYNHEKFIEETLDGILKQETTFNYNIIIHDDCSTDGTQKTLKKIKHIHPNKITLILQKENQVSKGIKPSLRLIEGCTSNYIAICDGDDKWTDKNKIQKQIEFLEKNKEYVVSGHNAVDLNENNYTENRRIIPDKKQKNYNKEELMRGNFSVITSSIVFRNIIKKFPKEAFLMPYGDYFLLSYLGQYGKFKFHSDIENMYYRQTQHSRWSILKEEQKIDLKIQAHIILYQFYKHQKVESIYQYHWDYSLKLMLQNTKIKDNNYLYEFYNDKQFLPQNDKKQTYSKFLTIIESQLGSYANKEIILYAINDFTEIVYEKLKNEYSVKYFIDSNKIGTTFFDKRVTSLEVIDRNSSFVFIVTAINGRYINEITKTIKLHNENNIVISIISTL